MKAFQQFWYPLKPCIYCFGWYGSDIIEIAGFLGALIRYWSTSSIKRDSLTPSRNILGVYKALADLEI